MPIINRDLSKSQQRFNLPFTEISVIGTGTTTMMAVAPFNCTLDGIYAGFAGISNSPVVSFNAYRIVSAGFTSVGMGVTITPQAIGNSGLQGFSLVQAGGVTLLAGDIVVMVMTGTNAAVAGTLVDFVMRGLADINSYGNVIG